MFSVTAPAALDAREGLADWDGAAGMMPGCCVRDEDDRSKNHERCYRKK
jgi:hypothetical protein